MDASDGTVLAMAAAPANPLYTCINDRCFVLCFHCYAARKKRKGVKEEGDVVVAVFGEGGKEREGRE